MQKTKKKIILLALLAGALMRFYFAITSDPVLRWDSVWYKDAANEALSGKLVADCCHHGAGYPLFLALVSKPFGAVNLDVTRLVQAGLDLLTGVIIGVVAYRMFGTFSGITAWTLYAFNPFTSSNVGIVMSEILSIFTVALIAYIVTLHTFGKRPSVNLLFGSLLAFLIVTKPSFLWSILFIAVALLRVIPGLTQKIRFVFFLFLGALIVFLYPLGASAVRFGKPSVVPPYQVPGWSMYLSLYSPYTPELLAEFVYPHPEWVRANQQYFYWTLNDISRIPVYEKYYRAMVIQQLRSDWVGAFRIYIRNVFLLWDKRHLGIYTDPFYPYDRWPLRIVNVVYILLALIGVVHALRVHAVKTRPFLAYSMSLCVYMSLLFPLVSNLSRHSLPFYPLLCIWAGVGVYAIRTKLNGSH